MSSGTPQGAGSQLSSLFHVLGGMGGIPQGHEKPLKHALYNAIALFLLVMFCAVGYALFLVLEPFFKPLLWALLVGSLLHPIKYSLATGMKKWFVGLEKTNRPFIIGVMAMPLDLVNVLSKNISDAISKYYKIAGIVILSAIALVWIINWFPWGCLCYVWKLVKVVNYVTSSFLQICNTYMFITLMAVYILTIALMWNKDREEMFRKSSVFVWLLVSAYLSHLTGSLQGVTFILFQFLALIGFSIEVFSIHNKSKLEGQEISYLKATKWTLLNKQNSFDQNTSEMNRLKLDTEDTPEESSAKTDDIKSEELKTNESDNSFPTRSRAAFQTRTLSSLPLSTPESKSALESQIVAALQRKARTNPKNEASQFKASTPTSNNESESLIYFKCLFWSCGCMVLWKHSWTWPLIPIIFAIYIIKALGTVFGVWEFIGKHVCDMYQAVRDWCSVRYSALMPAHVQGIAKMFSSCNVTIHNTAKDSVDSVSSVVVIVGLILFMTCAPIFMGIQIYSEGITVVQLTGSLINRTVVHNPELRQLLPPGLDETIDSLLDNAYLYGREGLSKAIKSVLQDSDSEKCAKIEKQLLELWDRLYQTWMSSDDTVGPQLNAAAIEQSWRSFVDDITKTPEIFNTSGLVDFAKQNIGTLMALLDSIWSLFKGNITLVLGSLSAFTSVLLGGSSAVLNFLLGMVVFFTTLFYLLNSSSVLYKPIEIISSFSPNNGSRFGLALTDAVNGVFKATLKMAVFYGMWTWLIHNLFGAQIVYLPSALAAILAAVPFLGTYLACVPAVLDLWLAQGQPTLAILLAICQFAPTSYVDTIIYNEIKNGGHPYFTGLAIAGGLFCLGVEGAIFGPLLLCCLLVVFNLSSSLFTETPMDERGSTIQARLGLHRHTFDDNTFFPLNSSGLTLELPKQI